MARYGLLSTKEPLDFNEAKAQFKELKQKPTSSALPIKDKIRDIKLQLAFTPAIKNRLK